MRRGKKSLALLTSAAMLMGLSVSAGTVVVNAEEETSIRFLDVSPSAARQEYYNSTFEKFEEETGIHVEYESVPWDDASTKISVMGTSGELPDVITTWTGWLGQFTEAEWIVPLDDYLAGREDEFSDIVVNITWAGEKQSYGHIYTMPDGYTVKGVFVRKDWCEEAGIELDPDEGWTWDEYFDVCAKLTDPEKNRYGVTYRGAQGAFEPMLVYMDGLTGGRTYDDEGNILINTPEGLEYYKNWTNLYLNGYAPKDSINWGFTEMVDNFTGGLTGTIINDSEVAAMCEANMEDGTWMVMPIPTAVDGKIYNMTNAPYAYTISSQSENQDAAWQLLDFLAESENNIEYCEMGGMIPIKKDAAEDPKFGEDGSMGVFIKQLNNPNLVVPATFGQFESTDISNGLMYEESQKYLLGQQSAEDALNNICTELEKRMKEYLVDNPGSVEQPRSMTD